MQNNIDTIPFFFIVGRARSGTTLLRCLLDAHPEINIPLECAFIVHLSSKYGKKTNWDEESILSFYQDLQQYPKFHFWTIDKEKLKKDLLNSVGKNSYSNICKVVYFNFKSFFPKSEIKLLGDKNPSYSFHTKKLLKLFPDARFIHITRDYRDNIISMINAKFEAKIFSSLAFRWKFSNKAVIKQKKLTPERFYTLRYEDLVEKPESYIKDICQFLKIDFIPEMMDYHSKLEELKKIYPAELINRHHKSLFQPINADKIYSWKKLLTEKQIKICDNVVGSFAEELGYERRYKRSFFMYMSCLPGMFYGRLLPFAMGIINKLPLNLRMKFINGLAIIFKHDWKMFQKSEINHK
ncbi:MAG: sulfotransferase [Bacteroidetes bacterium]|nr:sulfotransferase [Bacteroidota bacterium]